MASDEELPPFPPIEGLWQTIAASKSALRRYLAALSPAQRAAVGVFSQGEVESKSLYSPLHAAAVQLWDALAKKQRRLEMAVELRKAAEYQLNAERAALAAATGDARELGRESARLRSELTAARERAAQWAAFEAYYRANRNGSTNRMYSELERLMDRLDALAAPPPKSNEGEKDAVGVLVNSDSDGGTARQRMARVGEPMTQSDALEAIFTELEDAAEALLDPIVLGQCDWFLKLIKDGREALRGTGHPHPAPTGEPCPNCGEDIPGALLANLSSSERAVLLAACSAPLCVQCRLPWVPPEGVDATQVLCHRCTDARIAQPAAAQGEPAKLAKWDRFVVSAKSAAYAGRYGTVRETIDAQDALVKIDGDCAKIRMPVAWLHSPIVQPPAKERGEVGEGPTLHTCINTASSLYPTSCAACQEQFVGAQPASFSAYYDGERERYWQARDIRSAERQQEKVREVSALQSTLAERDREVERLKGIATQACVRAAELIESEQRVRGLEGERDTLRAERDQIKAKYEHWTKEQDGIDEAARERYEKAEAERDELNGARMRAQRIAVDERQQRIRLWHAKRDLTVELASERQQRADREAGVQEMRAGYEQRIEKFGTDLAIRTKQRDMYEEQCNEFVERIEKSDREWRALTKENAELRARVEAAQRLADEWQALACKSGHPRDYRDGLLLCVGQLAAILNPSEPGKVEPK